MDKGNECNNANSEFKKKKWPTNSNRKYIQIRNASSMNDDNCYVTDDELRHVFINAYAVFVFKGCCLFVKFHSLCLCPSSGWSEEKNYRYGYKRATVEIKQQKTYSMSMYKTHIIYAQTVEDELISPQDNSCFGTEKNCLSDFSVSQETTEKKEGKKG